MKTYLPFLLLGCLLWSLPAQAQPYCQPTYTDVQFSFDYIDGFVMGTINNTGSGQTAAPGYIDYAYGGSNFITSVAPGIIYQATITSGPVSPLHYYAIWVDLDRDFNYEPDELLATALGDNPNVSTITVDIMIPAGAPRGYTNMRVMCVKYFNPTDPCGTYQFGETEDYTVVIDDGAPCIPVYPNGTSEGDYIDGFQFNTINNIGSGAQAGAAYSDYRYGGPNYITSVTPGGTYTATITSGPDGTFDQYSIWVDMDGDLNFEPNELLAQASAIGSGVQTTSVNVTIPATTLMGYKSMRVMCTHASFPPNDACGLMIHGETEDYTLIIDDGAPCIPVYLYGTSAGDYIDGVEFEGINNTGSGSTGGSAFTSYLNAGPDFITSVAPGGSYPMTITSGLHGSSLAPIYYTVWVDLDRNSTFDPMEKLAVTVTYDAGVQLQLNVAIPADAATGYTRMRVMCTYFANPTDACGTFDYGETEDYTIVIDDGSTCIPLYGAQTTAGDFVAAVELNNLSWTVPTVPPTWGYESAMIHGAHLQAGVFSELTVTKGTSPGENYIYAWIDWTGDGLDASDMIGGTLVNGPGAYATFGFTPGDVAGYKRMRIACVNGPLTNNAPCDPAVGGHAVDFAVSVGHVGLPCYPLQGYGAVAGDGIESMVLQGFTYNGVQEFPYHTLVSLNEHRFDASASDALQINSGSWGFTDHTLALDMNDDGDFSDANEVLGTIQSTAPNEVLLLNFTIPATCPPGQHYLRLRAHYPNEPLGDLCEDSNYGSINDVVLVVEDPAGPCVPFSNTWTLENDFIDGVQLGGAQNLGTGGQYGPAYSAYLSPAIGILAGMPDTLRITSGGYPGDYYSAWIDHNGDNDFDDANELLGWISIADPYSIGELPFTVPNGTLPGNKRMRVRCTFDVISDACATTGWGETEDYTVNVDMNTGLTATGTPDFLVLPTPDGAQLVSDAAYIGYTFTLFDATGRALITGRIAGDRTDLPMTAFAKGAYTVVLNNDTERAAKRFVW